MSGGREHSAHRDREKFQKFHNGFLNGVKLDVEARVREGVKAVLEKVLQEEMTDHLGAHRESTSSRRRGERDGHYRRDLLSPAGKVEDLRVPRDREGEFVTEVFERYKGITGNVEESILEMYLTGISTRKIAEASAGITDALSGVKVGKDTVSRIASRLDKEQSSWRERGPEKD